MPESYLVDPTVAYPQSVTPQPAQPQSYAPTQPQQYPTELGTNPMVQQAYNGQQQATQGIQRIAQQQQSPDSVAAYQNLVDTVNLVKKLAPTSKQLDADTENLNAAQAKVSGLETKGRVLLAAKHPLRDTIVRMASVSPILGGIASQLSGASKDNRDAFKLAQDIMSGRAQFQTTTAQQNADTEHLKNSIAAQDLLLKAQQAHNTSSAQTYNEMAAIASHWLGIAKTPYELEHTFQQTQTSKSAELLNNYYRDKGLPAAKVESEKLGNQEKEQNLIRLKNENAKGPEQKLTPAQTLAIHQYDGYINDARAEHKTAQGRYNGLASVIQATKAPKNQQEIDDLAAKKAQLATFKEQIDHADDTIKTYQHMQTSITTPIHGKSGSLVKPDKVSDLGTPNVDENGNPISLHAAPAPATDNSSEELQKLVKIARANPDSPEGKAAAKRYMELKRQASDGVKKNSNVSAGNVVDQAVAKYPKLKSLNPAGLMSTDTEDNGNMLEHWSPGDMGTSKRPRPKELPTDRVGIQVFNSKTTPDDVAGDIVSHRLVNTDPKISGTYKQFKESLTPKQKEFLRGDYDWEVKETKKSGSDAPPPFNEWLDRVGAPAALRGYAFNQYDARTQKGFGYTDEQKGYLNKIKNYVQGK
jgi:hypothetical protein